MGGTFRAPLAAACLAVIAALAPAGLRAADGGGEALMEPASPWNAAYEDGRCRLSRLFGPPDRLHALIFEQFAPGARFNMVVAGHAVADLNAGLPLQLGFGPDGAATDQDIVKARNPEFGTAVFMKDVDLAPKEPVSGGEDPQVGLPAMGTAIDTAAAAPLRSVSLVQGKRRLTFKTGPLAAALVVLNDCTGHILETWGIDPAAQRSASRAAALQDEMMVARAIQEHYPLKALMQGRGGVVAVAALVDQTGKATECKIIHDSGVPEMNAMVCEKLMKARFIPALDAGGKPMKSFWTTRVTYRLG